MQKATMLKFSELFDLPKYLSGEPKQASRFFNKNLTNADNDNSMNMSTKMEMSQVNKPANNVQTMQYVKINIQTYKHHT